MPFDRMFLGFLPPMSVSPKFKKAGKKLELPSHKNSSARIMEVTWLL